jgi:hypothetical protein
VLSPARGWTSLPQTCDGKHLRWSLPGATCLDHRGISAPPVLRARSSRLAHPAYTRFC